MFVLNKLWYWLKTVTILFWNISINLINFLGSGVFSRWSDPDPVFLEILIRIRVNPTESESLIKTESEWANLFKKQSKIEIFLTSQNQALHPVYIYTYCNITYLYVSKWQHRKIYQSLYYTLLDRRCIFGSTFTFPCRTRTRSTYHMESRWNWRGGSGCLAVQYNYPSVSPPSIPALLVSIYHSLFCHYIVVLWTGTNCTPY